MKNARVKYSPSIPTSINCNLITYHETDVEDADPSGSEGLNIALAHRNAVQHSANVPCYIKCVTPGDKLWTSKGTSERQDALGKIITVMRQSPVNFAGEMLPSGTSLGDLTLEWDCLFETANLEPRPAATSQDVNLSTDSSVDQLAVNLDLEQVLMIAEITPTDPLQPATISYNSSFVASVEDGELEIVPLYGPQFGALVLTNVSAHKFYVFGAEVVGGK
jgi:hypothetical protein